MLNGIDDGYQQQSGTGGDWGMLTRLMRSAAIIAAVVTLTLPAVAQDQYDADCRPLPPDGWMMLPKSPSAACLQQRAQAARTVKIEQGKKQVRSNAEAGTKRALATDDGQVKTSEVVPEDETPPIAEAVYADKTIAVQYEGLSVELAANRSHDSKVCQPYTGSPSTEPTLTECEVLTATGHYHDHVAFTSIVSVLDRSLLSVELLHATVEIRRLDATTPMPQVVLTTYSGGAHCCTSTKIITGDTAENWHEVVADELDGGYRFFDPDHNGSSNLVASDESFLWSFDAYAMTRPPTRIFKLVGVELKDVTKHDRYRGFLLKQLREMEHWAQTENALRSSGYLAGWVAQKILVNQFDDAWRTVLASSRSVDDLDSCSACVVCRVDARVWQDKVCPQSEKVTVPFPEALAVFLVEHGYLTPDQSTRVGYDVTKIKADRTAGLAAPTQAYENKQEQIARDWHSYTRDGDCIRSQTPSSPAELISFDRADGLTDDVLVLKSDGAGKPMAVKVGEPTGNGMETVYMFFRGASECEAYRQSQQRKIKDLQ
jgi:hypothetical protein